MLAATVPPSHRDLLETPHTVALATVGSDGMPQVTAVWAMLEGDVVRTSLLTSRQKYRNLVARPQATVFVMDPANPYRTLEVRGVVELTDDPGLEFMDRIVRFYGMDPATFPGPREGRVLLTLRPTRVVETG